MDTPHRPPSDSSLLIGDCRLEPALLRLHRDEHFTRLEPKAVELLLFLAERAPEVVTRAEIFERVWQGRAVVDETLTRCVSLLRQALGDSAQDPRYIETIPRRGYRLLAEVQRRPDEVASERVEDEEEVSELPAPAVAVPRLWPRLLSSRSGLILAALLAIAAAFWLARQSQDQAFPAATDSRRSSFTPGSPISEPKIAVLPFENLSGDDRNRYLSDGMTEELIHQLAALSGLRIVSRTSVTSDLISGQSMAEIGRRLRADYLLEGSVLTVGDRIRITAQLIRPDLDEHLWSRSYDRELADVLGLHRDVALDVAREVEAELTAPERLRLGQIRAVDPAAYKKYLEGRQALGRRTIEEVKRALELLNEAVALDGSFADAWAALADAHLLSDPYLKISQTVAYGRAQEAIDKALELDPNLTSAHVSLGLLKLFRDWDWDGSEAAYRHAIALEPSYARAHQWLSEMLSLAGRHDEALDEIRIAVDLDPLAPLIHAAWGQRLNAAGQHREALLRFSHADTLGATFFWHRREMAFAYERLGDEQTTVETLVRYEKARGLLSEGELATLADVLEAGTLQAYWSWRLSHMLASNASEPVLIGEAFAALGDHEAALPWLRAAVQKRGGWFLHIAKSPAFDGLRDDPRFQALVEQARPSPS